MALSSSVSKYNEIRILSSNETHNWTSDDDIFLIDSLTLTDFLHLMNRLDKESKINFLYRIEYQSLVNARRTNLIECIILFLATLGNEFSGDIDDVLDSIDKATNYFEGMTKMVKDVLKCNRNHTS